MRKLDEKSLGNSALHYLKRYSATRRGLTDVLVRKAKRHQKEKGEPWDAGVVLPVIEAVVERMVRAGYVNDAQFTESKTASLRRQGKSSRVIALKLRLKGVGQDLIAEATRVGPEVDFEAACVLVRKKKLGRDPARRQKDLAVLLRNGFSFDCAKRALAQGPT